MEAPKNMPQTGLSTTASIFYEKSKTENL